MIRRDPATLGNGPIRRPRRLAPTCRRPDCGGELVTNRDGGHVATTCSTCGHDAKDRYAPRPKPKLDTEEPYLTKGLEMYCDLRRRGYTHKAIRSRTGWLGATRTYCWKCPAAAACKAPTRIARTPSASGLLAMHATWDGYGQCFRPEPRAPAQFPTKPPPSTDGMFIWIMTLRHCLGGFV